MEKTRKKNILAIVATNLSTAVTILLALWLFGEPAFNAKVDARNKLFLQGAEVKVFVQSVFETEKAKAVEAAKAISNEEEAKKLKLRYLFSIKSGIDQDEVHIEYGKMYKWYKEFPATMDSLIIYHVKKEVRARRSLRQI